MGKEKIHKQTYKSYTCDKQQCGNKVRWYLITVCQKGRGKVRQRDRKASWAKGAAGPKSRRPATVWPLPNFPPSAPSYFLGSISSHPLCYVLWSLLKHHLFWWFLFCETFILSPRLTPYPWVCVLLNSTKFPRLEILLVGIYMLVGIYTADILEQGPKHSQF